MTDPRFCGWPDLDIDIPDSSALAAALYSRDFAYSLAPDSPCLAGGEGGSRMGADTGVCQDQAAGCLRWVR